VLFCGLFTTFFVYFFNPFDIQSISYQQALGSYLSILSVGIWGALVLTFTQFLLRPLLGLNALSLGQFILWVIFELMLLGAVSFLIFGEMQNPFFEELWIVMKYTLSLAILPYGLACLLIAVFKLSNKAPEVIIETPQPIKRLQLKEQNGKIALTLAFDHLRYLKSDANYTEVYFMDHQTASKKIIRNNLKRLEKDLEDFELLRVHRSYMINKSSISQIERHKGSFRIKLEGLPDLWLKVSESYKQDFEKAITVP